MKSKFFAAIFVASALLLTPVVTMQAQTTTTKATNFRSKSPKTNRKPKVERAAQDVETGAKDTGEDVAKGTAKAGEVTGREVDKAAKDTAVGAKDVSKDVSKDGSKVAKKTGRAATKVGKKIKHVF
jgi:hypothetical protein